MWPRASVIFQHGLGFAKELLFILDFQAFQPLAVDVAKPQNLARQAQLGIVALGLGDQVNRVPVGAAGDLGRPGLLRLGGLPGPERLFALGGEMPFHKDKGAGPGKDLLQIPSLIAQNRGELPAQAGGILDLAGMSHHGRNPGADGQLGTVTVQDHAPHRQDGAKFLVFLGSLFPQFRPPDDLQVKKTAADIQAEG